MVSKISGINPTPNTAGSSRIESLPDELLAGVALCLDAGPLKALRATSQRLSPIAHEVMEESLQFTPPRNTNALDIAKALQAFKGMRHFKASPSMTDQELIALTKNCPHLNDLNLCECTNLTDDGIIQATQNCPHLNALDLSWCTSLTDDGIIQATQNCPHLNTLCLNGSTNLTDTGLFKATKNCKKLTFLDVQLCPNLTDTGLFKATQNCPQLTCLLLTWCKNLTDAGISQIRQKFPSLKIFH